MAARDELAGGHIAKAEYELSETRCASRMLIAAAQAP